MALKVLAVLTATAASAAILTGLARPWFPTSASFAHPISWAATGVWLKAETHTHTTFSDGVNTVDELADRAVANGCDVLAITDHSDARLRAATPEYHDAIRAARARLPQLLLMAGLEWNVPPGKGHDHAVILLPAAWDTSERTAEFKRRFDDLGRDQAAPALAAEGFAWFRSQSRALDEVPVVVLDHPGRRASDTEAVFQTLSLLAREGKGVLVAAEGAPGHQHATPLGAYERSITPEDRWDPSVVAPGAAWDRLLQQGVDIWGALASSDFHSARERRRLAVRVLLHGDLRARPIGGGCAARAARGQLSWRARRHRPHRRVTRRRTRARAVRPSRANNCVLPAGTTLSVDLVMNVAVTDWSGAANHIDTVDLIGVTTDGARIVASGAPGSNGRWHADVTMPAGGIVLRARGRRVIEDGPDLLFYTNPVRVTTP